MKKRQRYLLYYTAFGVTVNSVMLFGYIKGYWN